VTWPVTLQAPPVGLRPLRYRDARVWHEVRARNADWLRPWDATPPDPRLSPVSFRTMVRRLAAQARLGESLPWLLTVDGRLAGQVNVSGIVRGSAQMAHIGYWIAQEHAGRGHMPTAVALAVDYCFGEMGLHRVEINIRPENAASLRVVQKLGLRSEGLRERYLHIDGDWRDHLSFAVTADEVPEGLLTRLRARAGTSRAPGRDTPGRLRPPGPADP
jgi:ribosomal-protein-alanine N-acetyltransferase